MTNKILTLVVLTIGTWLAITLGTILPLLGTSITAILIGVIIRHSPLYQALDLSVTNFVSKYLLKGAIVLLGFTLSMRRINEVGSSVVLVLLAVLLVSIIASLLANQWIKSNPNLALLIGIGTSICGGAAIVAVAPILHAEDEEIAVSITTMFFYSMLALLLLPSIGILLQLSDQTYGILVGAAVNDTASVVATAFSWSDAAGEIGTIVKLVRTLLIVPVTLGAIFYKFIRQQENPSQSNLTQDFEFKQILKIIPLFVVLFTLAVLTASIIVIPSNISSTLSQISKMLMTLALLTVGLGVHIEQIKEAGLKPILLGAITWSSVLLISTLMIQLLY